MFDPKPALEFAKKNGITDEEDPFADDDLSTPYQGRNLVEEEKKQATQPAFEAQLQKESEEASTQEISDEELKALHDAELERYRFKDRRFPTAMGEEAFYGVAGDIVRIISPVSEASREATLSQFLVAIANLLGRSAHRKQAGIHHLNEDTVIVGETAIARKGSSWVPIYSLLNLIAQDWTTTRIKDGFQSGEAIIHAVRDQMSGTIPVNKRKAGHADVAEEAVLDHGVDDKRLLQSVRLRFTCGW